MIDILDLKITNDFCSIGASNLIGGLAGKCQAEIDFIIHWEVQSKDLTLFGNQIARNDGGDFILDGFRIGQRIYVRYTGTDSTPVNEGEFKIANISSGVLTLVEVTGSDSSSTIPNGTLPFTTEIGTTEYDIFGLTKIQNIDFYYGLVENLNSPSYTSLLDGEIQKYTINNLDADAFGSSILNIANSNKSWLFGSSADINGTIIEELGTGTSGVSTGFEQRFKITIPFYIAPPFSPTFVNGSNQLDGNLVSFLMGSNSLKFVPKIEAGTDNSSTIFTTDNGNISSWINNGDVGFYDQYRNTGITPEYSIGSISYADPNGNSVDGLLKNATTSVSIVLNSVNSRFLANNTKVRLSVYEIPEDFNDVLNNTSTAFTNFDVSTLLALEGVVAATNNNIVDYEVNIASASQINLIFDYTAPNDDKSYVIVVETYRYDEPSLVDSDGLTLLADYREFEFYVDLTDVYTSTNGITVNEHSSNALERSYTDYKGWKEDGVLFTNAFRIYKLAGYSNEYATSLRNVNLKIEVENSTDASRNFTLEEFTLLPPNQDTGRSFLLPTADPKNYLKITEDTDTSGYTAYTIKYATKLRWMSWFTQPNADPDFATPTQAWDTYQTGDWSIKCNMYFNLSAIEDDGTRLSFVVKHGVDVGIYDYGDNEDCNVDYVIETFHEPTMTNLQGQISKTANTFVRATFTGKKMFPCIWDYISGSGSVCSYQQVSSGSGSASESNSYIFNLDCPDLYGILELCDEQAGGIDTIRQISTMYDPETDTPWIGEAGVRAKLTLYPYIGVAVVEAVLDVDLIDTTKNYQISARIGEKAQTICLVAIFHQGEDLLTYTNNDLIGYTENDLLIFGTGLNQDSLQNIISYSAPTITFKTSIAYLKITCASNGRIDDTKSGSSYSNAALVGLSTDDFLFFMRDGKEATTQIGSGYTFTSGTGTMAYTGNNGQIIIDFKPSIVSTSVSSVTSYTDVALTGLNLNDILVFAAGVELSTLGILTMVGNTLYFSSAVSGLLKVVRVNG